MASRRPRFLMRAGLALASLVFALLAVELGLRAFKPVKFRRPERGVEGDWGNLVHRPSDVPGLLYELAPDRVSVHNDKTITVNSLGMRDAEPREPVPGMRRILVLGDSVSFGLGVEDNETWPHVLDARLRQAEARGGPPFDVLNMAVSGYSTLDEYAQLKHRGLELDPDFVIVGYFLNDPEVEPVNNLHATFAPTEWWQHSHLLRLVASKQKTRERERYGRVDGRQDYFHYLHRGPSFRSVLKGFDGFAEVSRANDLPVLVALFPSYRRKNSWKKYFYRDLHAQVAAAARERGMHVLDLLPAFEASGRVPAQLRVDNWHPNPAGHRVAAEAIQEWLDAHAAEIFGD